MRENLRREVAVWAPAVLKLFRGVLYQEDRQAWNLLMTQESPIRSYLAQIGVALRLDESEGYAFLTQGNSGAEELEDEESDAEEGVGGTGGAGSAGSVSGSGGARNFGSSGNKEIEGQRDLGGTAASEVRLPV